MQGKEGGQGGRQEGGGQVEGEGEGKRERQEGAEGMEVGDRSFRDSSSICIGGTTTNNNALEQCRAAVYEAWLAGIRT